jgi:predicted ArsR family transcriptional regulator
MKTFIEYLKNLSENVGKQDALNELIKLAWSRYNPETKDFLEKMSNKDADMNRLLDKLNNFNYEDENLNKDDEIYKNTPDANFGNEEV